jgi:hypothetical protein
MVPTSMPTTPLGWNTGSEWHRWDPHIHTPGTLLNDGFAGNWDEYIDAIENAAPPASRLLKKALP